MNDARVFPYTFIYYILSYAIFRLLSYSTYFHMPYIAGKVRGKLRTLYVIYKVCNIWTMPGCFHILSYITYFHMPYSVYFLILHTFICHILYTFIFCILSYAIFHILDIPYSIYFHILYTFIFHIPFTFIFYILSYAIFHLLDIPYSIWIIWRIEHQAASYI